MSTVRIISTPPAHQRRIHGFRLLSNPVFGWFACLGTIAVLILGVGWYFDSPPSPNRRYALLTAICLVISFMPVMLGLALLSKPLIGSILKKTHYRTVRRWLYNTVHLHLLSLSIALHTLRIWMSPNTSPLNAVLCVASTLISFLLFILLVTKIGKEISRRNSTASAQPSQQIC